MNGLFCFDGPMYRDINDIYCNTTLTNQVFNRYLKVVDNLKLAIRTFTLDKTYEEEHLHKLEMNNIQMVEFSNLNSIRGMIFERKKNYEKLYQLVLETDMVFARMPSIISNMAISIAQKLNKPYLVEVGGCAWDGYWNHGLQGKLFAPYMFFQTKRKIKHATYAVYVTQSFLQKRYPTIGKTAVCSNVILPMFDDQTFINRQSKIRCKDTNAPVIIGTTAAINVKYKGQEYIIEAISKLNNQGFNFEYELVGGGEKDYLEAIAIKYKVADKVRFLGVMLQKEVIEWLDSIDIYAQPSKQEGLPRALIEAMSRGCPSIGSNTAGIPELLNDDVIFEKGQIKEICKKLISMDKNKMLEDSKTNFEKSKEFNQQAIEKIRNSIFKQYLNTVEGEIKV